MIPPEVLEGLDHYKVAAPLVDVVDKVASSRSVTADPPGVGYVAVRPSAWGNVSAYFHASYVDVALAPRKARSIEQSHSWPVIKINSETGFVRIGADDLQDQAALDLAVALVLAAVDKSEAGTAYEGGSSAKAGSGSVPAICPSCFVAMPVSGVCESCG